MLLVLQLFTAAMALAGIAYCAFTLLAARSFLRRARPPAAAEIPEVTVLKPLSGLASGLEHCLRSHLDQDYPSYTVVFGVAGEQDPVLEALDPFLREGEGRTGLIVVERRGPNRKIGTLLGMQEMLGFAHKAGPGRVPSILLINDADICVPPDYLTRVVAAFGSGDRQREVGMVTTVYRAVPAPTLGSWLEALGIATDLIPGVLAARSLEGGLGFALGATMAIRRDVLKRIGGLEPLLDHLADDYELGRRVRDAGYEVALADTVVETNLPAYSLRGWAQHQLRWARSVRASRPGGYAGLVFTHVLFWSLLTVAAAGAATWSLGLLVAAAVARLTAAGYISSRVLRDHHALRHLWLVPVRDLIGVFIWLGAYTGRTVVWRGERFVVEEGKLRSLEAEPAEQEGSFEGDSYDDEQPGASV